MQTTGAEERKNEMNYLPEEELLEKIGKTNEIDSDRSVFDDLVYVREMPLSNESTQEELFCSAENPIVIINDDNPDGHDRMPIRIFEDILVYQDCADGYIYPSKDSKDSYSVDVQNALVEKGHAFGGDGIGCGDEMDAAIFASFVKNQEFDRSEIRWKSKLAQDLGDC